MLLVVYPCPSAWSIPVHIWSALTEPEGNNIKIMTTIVIMVKILGSQEGDRRVGARESEVKGDSEGKA